MQNRCEMKKKKKKKKKKKRKTHTRYFPMNCKSYSSTRRYDFKKSSMCVCSVMCMMCIIYHNIYVYDFIIYHTVP